MSRYLRSIAILTGLLLFLSVGGRADVGVETETLVKGKGAIVKVGDRTLIAYSLSLGNGKAIEKTPDGKAYEVEVGSPTVVPGMSLGMVGMEVGEKRRIVIPPELAYGAKGSGPIPANATLIFEITLYGMADAAAASPTPVSHVEDDDHDHEHEHEHGAEDLGNDGSEGRPDAQNLDKPAMFEYLIRDFFSRPWRSPDAAKALWRGNAWLTLVTLGFFLLGYLRDRHSSRVKS